MRCLRARHQGVVGMHGSSLLSLRPAYKTLLVSIGMALGVLAVCVSVAHSAAGTQWAQWQTYTSGDGRLRFQYPSDARIIDTALDQVEGLRSVDVSFDICAAAEADTAHCIQASIGIREINHADAAALVKIETDLLTRQGYARDASALLGAPAARYYRVIPVATDPMRREIWYVQAISGVLRLDFQVLPTLDPAPYRAAFMRMASSLLLTPTPRWSTYLPIVRGGAAAAAQRQPPARPDFVSSVAVYDRQAVKRYIEMYASVKNNDDGMYVSGGDAAHFIARAITSGGAVIPNNPLYQNTTVGLYHYILDHGLGQLIPLERATLSLHPQMEAGDVVFSSVRGCEKWGGVIYQTYPLQLLAMHSPESNPAFSYDAFSCRKGAIFIRMGSDEITSGLDPLKDFYRHGNHAGDPKSAYHSEFATEQISYTLKVSDANQIDREMHSYVLPVSLLSDTQVLTLPYSLRGAQIELAKPVEYFFRRKIYSLSFADSIRFVQTAIAAGQCAGRTATAAAFYAQAARLQDYDLSANYVVETRETKQLLEFIDVYQGRQVGSVIQDWLHDYGWKKPLDIVDVVSAKMLDGQWSEDPYIIGIYTSNTCDDVKVGHALLPYKIVRKSSAEYQVYVFDPNYPLFTQPNALNKYISVNRIHNTWSYEFFPGIIWSGASLSFVPLSKFTQQTTYAGDSGAVISLSGTRGRDRSLAGGDQGGSCIALSSPITVSQILSATNVFHRLIPYGGDISQFPHALYAPGSAVAGRDLDFYFNEAHPEATPRADNSVIGPNTLIGYYGTLGQQTTNALHIRKDFRSFSLRTNLSLQTVSPYISRRDEPGRSTLFYGLSNIPLRRGEALTVTVAASGLEITNQGASKTFTLGVAFVGDQGLSRYTRQLSAPANSRVIISAWDWSRLDRTAIFAYTDTGNDGSFEQEQTLQDARPTQVRVTPLSYLAPDGAVYFVASQARLVLSAAPTSCCLAATRYRLDSGSWMSYTLPVALDVLTGAHRIEFFSYDTVSNTERLNTRTLIAYQQPPTTAATLDGPQLPDGSYTGQVTVTLRATSYLSDVVRAAGAAHTTYYRLNSGERRRYQGPVMLSSAGLTTLEFWTVDAAGYAERPQQLDLRVYRQYLSVVPLDSSQKRLEEAYGAVFRQLRSGGAADRLLSGTSAAGQPFPSGAVVMAGQPGGAFSRTELLSSALVISPTVPLRAPRVALIANPHSWELGSFTDLLDGLFDLEHVALLTATQVTTAALADIDVAFVPSVGVGEVPGLLNDLGVSGQAALRWFGRQPGRTLYLQGQSTLLAAALDSTFSSTVAPAEQIVAPGGQASVLIADPRHPLMSNLVTSTLALDRTPLLRAGAGLSALLSFSDTDHPGAPAMLVGTWGQGRMVLVAGHPTLRVGDRQYPLVANLLLTAVQQPLRLGGTVRQNHSRQLPDNTLSDQRGVSAEVTRSVSHANPLAVDSLVLTDTIDPAFAVSAAAPAPTRILSATVLRNGRWYPYTTLVWELSSAAAAQPVIRYTVAITAPELLGTTQTVAAGLLRYQTTADRRGYSSSGSPLTVRLVRPAVLTGTLSAGQGDVYPLKRDGLTAEQIVAVRNTEGSAAADVRTQLLIPLLTPAFDLASGTAALEQASAMLPLFTNTIEFLEQTARYPLPDGVTDWQHSLSLDDWDGTTVYTISVPAANLSLLGPPDPLCGPVRGVRLPPRGWPGGAVRLLPDGAVTYVVLPALQLTWSHGSLPGFTLQSPGQGVRVRTAEHFGRSVALRGAPEPGSLVLNSDGVAFLTQLGGDRSPPRLRPEWRAPRVDAGPQGSIVYSDLWARLQKANLPQSFSTLLIPASYHASPGSPPLWSNFSRQMRRQAAGWSVGVSVRRSDRMHPSDPHWQARHRAIGDVPAPSR